MIYFTNKHVLYLYDYLHDETGKQSIKVFVRVPENGNRLAIWVLRFEDLSASNPDSAPDIGQLQH